VVHETKSFWERDEKLKDQKRKPREIKHRHWKQMGDFIWRLAKFTYKCSGKGISKDCSLRRKMVHPDSMNVIYKRPLSMIGKRVKI
jgi:hypothetical protein